VLWCCMQCNSRNVAQQVRRDGGEVVAAEGRGPDFVLLARVGVDGTPLALSPQSLLRVWRRRRLTNGSLPPASLDITRVRSK